MRFLARDCSTRPPLHWYLRHRKQQQLRAAATAAPPSALADAAKLIGAARSVLWVTGAGVSAESGLPTYRGVSGLYSGGITSDGHTIEECLSGPMFRTRAALTWRYILQIERACRGAEPNEAHRLIAASEAAHERVTVITQNVDGLHTRAGSTDVISLHGDLSRLVCSSPRCGWERAVAIGGGDDDDEWSYDAIEARGAAPPCPKCGAAVRPRVVLFEEMLYDDACASYHERLGAPLGSPLWALPGGDHAPFDVSVAVGTSAPFPYVINAALSGRRTIEINPDETPTTLSGAVDVRVRASAGEALRAIYGTLLRDT